MPSKREPIVHVHLQERHGCSADIRTADDFGSDKSKMLVPLVAARMKQPRDFSCSWINTWQIRAFEPIASIASPGEIVDVISATVLVRHDVLNVKRKKDGGRRKKAILAMVASARPHDASKSLVHQLLC